MDISDSDKQLMIEWQKQQIKALKPLLKMSLPESPAYERCRLLIKSLRENIEKLIKNK